MRWFRFALAAIILSVTQPVFAQKGGSNGSYLSGKSYVTGPSSYSGSSSYTGPSGYTGQSSYTGQSAIHGPSSYSGNSSYSGASGYTGQSSYSGNSSYTGRSSTTGISSYTGQGKLPSSPSFSPAFGGNGTTATPGVSAAAVGIGQVPATTSGRLQLTPLPPKSTVFPSAGSSGIAGSTPTIIPPNKLQQAQTHDLIWDAVRGIYIDAAAGAAAVPEVGIPLELLFPETAR